MNPFHEAPSYGYGYGYAQNIYGGNRTVDDRSDRLRLHAHLVQNLKVLWKKSTTSFFIELCFQRYFFL